MLSSVGFSAPKYFRSKRPVLKDFRAGLAVTGAGVAAKEGSGLGPRVGLVAPWPRPGLGVVVPVEVVTTGAVAVLAAKGGADTDGWVKKTT